jgi:hypothetical protein
VIACISSATAVTPSVSKSPYTAIGSPSAIAPATRPRRFGHALHLKRVISRSYSRERETSRSPAGAQLALVEQRRDDRRAVAQGG